MRRIHLEVYLEDLEAVELRQKLGQRAITFDEEPINSQRYIILPGEFCTPEKYKGKHPDLLVADSRLSVSPETINVNPRLRNNRQGFISGLTFDQTEALYKKLKKQAGLFFLSPWYFNRFYNHIVEGINGERKVPYEGGETVPRENLLKIISDISEQRNPWRSHFLYARFNKEKDIINIIHPIVLKNGEIKLVTEPLGKNTLMKDKTLGISLEDWLKNPTAQGLARGDSESGLLQYWSPKDGYVPRFIAVSDRVYLYCDVHHRYSYSALGSWPARIFSSGNEGSKK